MKINDTKRVHIEQLRIECDKDYAPQPHEDAHFSYPCLGCMMEKGLAHLDVEKPPAEFHRYFSFFVNLVPALSNLMDLVEASKDSSGNRAGKGSHVLQPLIGN